MREQLTNARARLLEGRTEREPDPQPKAAGLGSLSQVRPGRPGGRNKNAGRIVQATGQIVRPYLNGARVGGAGTELKLLLKKFGIRAHTNCKCEQRAREMDANGIEWCEEHLEEIVDWMEEEAKNRHLPFLRTAGRILVRRAIKNAKRKRAILEKSL